MGKIQQHRYISTEVGAHSTQSFWGLAGVGQVVSVMFTTTLEEA